MNTSNARAIADGLTWFRVLSVIPITLFALANMRWWVFGVYIAASLTDFFDGVFARQAQPVRYGRAFDGNADVFFALMTFIWIAMLFPAFFGQYGWPLVLPLLLLQTLLFVLRIRQSVAGVAHLAIGRLSMFVFCLLLPVLLVFGDIPWFVVAVLALSVFAKVQLAWHMIAARDRETTASLT